MLHRVMVVASGTAGHILPSKELIEELIERGFSVDWLGYKTKLETDMEHPCLEHIKLVTQSPRSLARLFSYKFYKNLLMDSALIVNLFYRRDYSFILLTGGFVGFLPGLVAFFMRKKIFIYEQNVVLGSANRWFSTVANKIFFGLQPLCFYPHAVYTGQPLRSSIIQLKKVDASKCHLLIIGGSLGSSFFNNELLSLILNIEHLRAWKITHCCGAQADPNVIKVQYQEAGFDADVFCYLDDIASYYRTSTKVIARAGAMSISEILFLNLQALIIPLPNAAGNHQVKNALTLKTFKNFTVCLQEKVNRKDLINFLEHSCDNQPISIDDYNNPRVEIINQCLNS